MDEWFRLIKKHFMKTRCPRCYGKLIYRKSKWGCSADCRKCHHVHNIGWSRMMEYHREIQLEKENEN